jgi:hypothetical protein
MFPDGAATPFEPALLPQNVGHGLMELSVVLGQSANATATTIRALEESIAYRAKFLTEYQNQSYARNLGEKFEGDVRLQIPSCHAATGAPRQGDCHLQKKEYGGWMIQPG